MTLPPQQNPKGIVRICALCDVETTRFLSSHIPPRDNPRSVKYYVHPSCEETINKKFTNDQQQNLTIEEARKTVNGTLIDTPIPISIGAVYCVCEICPVCHKVRKENEG